MLGFSALERPFLIDNLQYFAYLWPKHRLGVLFEVIRVPAINVLSQKKENNVYHSKPLFSLYKLGFPWYSLHVHGIVNMVMFQL